jgi:hypothetical protein
MANINCREVAERYNSVCKKRREFAKNYSDKKNRDSRQAASTSAKEFFSLSKELRTALRLDFFEKNHPDWPKDIKIGNVSTYAWTTAYHIKEGLEGFRIVDGLAVCAHSENTEFHVGEKNIASKELILRAYYPEKNQLDSESRELYRERDAQLFFSGRSNLAYIIEKTGSVKILKKTGRSKVSLENAGTEFFKKPVLQMAFFSENSGVALTADSAENTFTLVFFHVDNNGILQETEKRAIKVEQGEWIFNISVDPGGSVYLHFARDSKGIKKLSEDEVGNHARLSVNELITENNPPLNVYEEFSLHHADVPGKLTFNKEKFNVKKILPSGKIIGVIREGRGVNTRDRTAIFSITADGRVLNHRETTMNVYHSAEEYSDGVILLGGTNRCEFLRPEGQVLVNHGMLGAGRKYVQVLPDGAIAMQKSSDLIYLYEPPKKP